LINISDLSNTLEFRKGIWYSQKTSSVSYPDEGNNYCFKIEDDSFWFQHRNNCIVELVKNFPPQGEIFDVGGGNGYVSARLERNGFTTVLVEPGLNGVANAGKRELDNIICSTLENAGFKTESIPAIGLFDVVEHIKGDLEFLNVAHDLLVAKGRLYLTVPAYPFLWSGEDRIANHFKRYNKKSITEILQTSGFKIEYASYIFFFLPTLIFFLKVLPYRMGIRKKEKTPENLKREHRSQNKLIRILISKLLGLEQGWINSKKRILFGSSLLIAASKE
jgi:SAM-dependent methyltransferase